METSKVVSSCLEPQRIASRTRSMVCGVAGGSLVVTTGGSASLPRCSASHTVSPTEFLRNLELITTHR